MSDTDRHTPYQPRPLPRTPQEQQERRKRLDDAVEAEVERMAAQAPYERY